MTLRRLTCAYFLAREQFKLECNEYFETMRQSLQAVGGYCTNTPQDGFVRTWELRESGWLEGVSWVEPEFGQTTLAPAEACTVAFGARTARTPVHPEVGDRLLSNYRRILASSGARRWRLHKALGEKIGKALGNIGAFDAQDLAVEFLLLGDGAKP